MEKQEFKVETLTEKDEKQLFDLLELCFGGGGEDRNFFHWKYKRFPGLTPKHTIVVKKDDVIAGVITLWPMRIKIGPRHTLDIMVAGGAATHPSFRGKGIWWKYMERARSLSREMGAGLLFGYVTTTTVTYRARVARGIHELFTQHYFVKILDYPNFFKASIKSQESKKLTQFSKMNEKFRQIDERILIIPQDGEPFNLVLRKGEIEILKKVVENPTIVIKGDVSKLIFARSIFGVLWALLTRRIRLKVPLTRIKRAYDVFQALRSMM